MQSVWPGPSLRWLLAAFALSLAGTASAAQLIDRNATGVQIMANAKGEAMLTYHKGSAVKHILVWGAINAITPREGGHQTKFKLDYSGGWGTKHTRLLEALPRQLRPLRRARASEPRRRVQVAGRLVLGGAELAAAASEPRLHAVGAGAARELARGLALDG